MATDLTQREAWQAEKDLLADGRELLERLCDTTRYRHLYPEGPNVALLLEAYQDLARRRLVSRERQSSRRRDWRRLRRLLKKKLRRDALARDRRLQFRYPEVRNRRLRIGLPPVVRRALENVDYDVRDDIARLIQGEERAGFTADRSISSQSRIEASLDRGLGQFRDALVNGALADPSSILALNAQHIAYAESAPPTKTRHPVATLVLVKMPLQLMMALWVLFSTAYIGAYTFFNDEVLGRFLTDKISGILDGELAFESVHWDFWLIFDLITGNPHTLQAKGVRVYEPFKSLGKDKDRVAAYAEHLELRLTLHEIIPWNRLGVPPVFEIPWILHFSDVHNHGELWVEAREYVPEGTDRRMIGLVDAFLEPVDTPSAPGQRKLSVRLDDADLAGGRVILDFREFGGWGTDLSFGELYGDLDFHGWYPEDERPDPLPLRWNVRGKGANGEIWMLGKTLVAENLDLADAGSGMHFTPLGDMRLAGEGTVAGSPAKFDGFLRGIYSDEKSVSYQVSSTDAHDIAQVFTGAEGDDRPVIVAHGDPARVAIEGPLDDPSLRMVAQGITVDLFPDPAWALDDVDVSLVMTRDPVPEMWAGDRPEAEPDDDDERWIFYLETLRGAGLDGSIRLHGKGQLDHVVLADGPEDPLLASIHLDLDGINPAQLAPDDPKLQDSLRGAADGGAELHKLVLSEGGSGGLERLHFFLHRARLLRDAGPNDDGLPRRLWADGDVLYDRTQGLDLRGLRLSTDGGYAAGSGGLDADWKHLDPTSLAVRIDDGKAFSRAFGIDQYFDRLTADLGLVGPLMSPTGRNGSLSISGVGSGDLSLTGVTNAKLWMDAGVLHLRSPNAGLLGGHGPLELDVVLFERGKLLSDPKVRLFVDLEGVDQRNIGGGPIHAEGASLRLYVDDGSGGTVRISELQARGAAYADVLELAGERYRNANASFALTRDAIRIDQLTVSYHRPVSPRLGPDVTVEVGTMQAKGTLGFQDDPELDLDLQARGLPLAALTSFIGEEIPMRGQLAEGSRIALRGTVSRPEIDGHVELDSLSGFGVPLGRGRLDFETNDVPPDNEAGAQPHRAIAIQGQFKDSRAHRDGSGLRWDVDATVAFGEASRKRKRPVEIDAGATFAALPVANLLAQPEQAQWRANVDGQLNDLRVRARYCPEGSSMLAACREDAGAESAETRVNIDLANLWVRPRGAPQSKAATASGDPCLDPTTLCSDTALHSVLEGDLVRLTQPWRLRSGGKEAALLAIDGTFDLSAAPPTPEAECRPGVRTSTPGGSGHAEFEGQFDLGALAAVLQAYDFQPPAGRVAVALTMDGHAGSPRVRGRIKLPPEYQSLDIEVGDEPDDRGRRKPATIPIALSDLDLDLQESTVYLAGEAKIFNEKIRFGEAGGPRSSLAVSGPCRGRYEITANGALDAALVSVLGGDLVESSSGSAELNRLRVAGDLGKYEEDVGIGTLLDTLSGELSFKRKAFRVRLPYEAVTIVNGKVEFQRCTAKSPCRGIPDGAYVVYVGGRQGSGAGSRPRDALGMTVGDRGRADAWGQVYLDQNLNEIRSATLRAAMSQVPYLQSDNAGGPELTAELSSRDLVFERDDLGDMVVRGKVLVEKGRWLRDAQEGVAILSFADPVPAPPEELPESIADLRLDLDLQTSAPFRVDNNVLKKFEAEGELSITGTAENPEVTGTVTVDRGELDLDILGEAYEVAEGKVRLDRELSSSFVDIVAIGKEPKKIDEQLHYITLRLRGPLDEISWECSALGDVSNELGSTRRCVDYVIFDAGNVDVAEQDVRRVGGTGLLYAGRPLTLVGKLTELEVNDYLEERIPRVERYLPYASVRLGQLGIETEIETRPEWLNWGWGDLGFGFNYMRGYPGSLVRDTRAFTGRLEILDHSALEFTKGTRNYTNRVLILDPPDYSRLEFLQNWQIPSAR